MKVSRSCDLGRLGLDTQQVGALDGNQILDLVAARPALELAPKRAVRAFRARATAAGGIPDLILTNRVAAAQDHENGNTANAS